MPEQHQIDFERIAAAIEYMYINFRAQPTLDEVAAQVNMSPFHFQRMFRNGQG